MLDSLMPKDGRPVMLWPVPGRRVQDGDENYGRFMPAEGGERTFNPYWHDRLMEGAVTLTDPTKNYRAGKACEASVNPAAVEKK